MKLHFGCGNIGNKLLVTNSVNCECRRVGCITRRLTVPAYYCFLNSASGRFIPASLSVLRICYHRATVIIAVNLNRRRGRSFFGAAAAALARDIRQLTRCCFGISLLDIPRHREYKQSLVDGTEKGGAGLHTSEMCISAASSGARDGAN